MKRAILTLAIFFAATTFIFGQSRDERAVRQVLDELAAALKNNDTAALDRIYADDYTFVGDTGVLTTKAQRLAAFKSGEIKYESISFNDMNIRVYGDTAVAIFSVTSKFAPGAKGVDGKFIVTATFVKAKNRWREVAVQNTRVGEQ